MLTLLLYVALPSLAYAAYAVIAFAFQRELLFAGRRRGRKPASVALPAGVERIWLRPPGAHVEAFYLPPPAAFARPVPAIVFAHGNAELIEDWPETLSCLRDLGMALLLVEYPGYGASDGQLSQASVRAALEAGYDWLAARPEVDRTRMLGFGRSLGGGAICSLVGRRPFAALILASTFTSVRAIALRMLLPGALVRDPFDNAAVLRDFDGPVLIVHGTRDATVPYAHGLRLSQIAKHVRFITHEGAHHNDCPPDWPRFAQELAAFLRAHDLLRRSPSARFERVGEHFDLVAA